MLKCLSSFSSRKKRSPEVVTDDPLATISVKRPSSVYSVSRSNPIFQEDSSCDFNNIDVFSVDLEAENYTSKSSSSGFQSKPSSSECCGSESINCNSDLGDNTQIGISGLEQKSSSIVQENANQARKCTVAVRGRKKQTKTVNFRSSCGTLATILEGKIDISIPRPVWPKNSEESRRENGEFQDSAIVFASLQFVPMCPQQESFSSDAIRCPNNILYEISSMISSSADKETGCSEEILNNITSTLHQKWHLHSSEEALKRLSLAISNSSSLNKLSRALKKSSKSVCFTCSDSTLSVGDSHWSKTNLGSATCSSSTSSGFSDLTHTPPSTSSSGSSSSRSRGLIEDNVNFSQEENVDNRMTLETLRKNFVDYDRLNGNEFVDDTEKNVDRSLWETYCGAEVVVGDVQLKCSSLYPYPDFTLDLLKSERLLNKIKAKKQQRRWCRFLTSIFALVFFLASVMIVSLFITNGKRIFGSI